MSKKTLLMLLTLMLSFSIIVVGCSSSNGGTNSQEQSQVPEENKEQVQSTPKVRNFNIATAGTAGALYPMGVAMGETISKHSDVFKAGAQASNGSVENIRNLGSGRVEMGISQNEVAYFAYNGLDEYEENEVKQLRSLFGTVTSWVQVFVKADSDINSISDFKGKRIGVGAPGSGGETASRRVLESYGISYDDIRPEYISDNEMVSALVDGTIDGFISTHPLNSAAMRNLVSSTKIRMLPVDNPSFYKKHPYYSMKEVPEGTYDGVSAINTATSKVYMFTTAEQFTDDEIYEILTLIFDNRNEWVDVHKALGQITLQSALDAVAVPLHPGAVKFFKERGVNVPSNMLP